MSILPNPHSPLADSQRAATDAMKKKFKWPNEAAVLEKLQEEIKEFESALANMDIENQKEELGDMFFTMVCLAAHMNLSADDILKSACQKFKGRFAKMEKLIDADGKSMDELSAVQLEEYWQKIK